MQKLALLALAIGAITQGLALSPELGTAVTLTPSGSIQTPGGMVVPPFPAAGAWTELPGKASERYETRHFLYRAAGEPPALELYIAADRRDEAPDGVFEMGLIKGFLHGFAPKAGLKYDEPIFQDRQIGQIKIKHALVKLTSEKRTLWVHAYIYPRRPSLTFLAIRAKDGEQMTIEKYLADIKDN